MNIRRFIKKNYQEFLFQFIVILMLFMFYTFDSTGCSNSGFFEQYKAIYFINYLISALVISYLLLPKFYYKQQYWYFFTGVFLVITTTLLVEEFLLEYIYFTETRYPYFDYFISLIDVFPIVFILVSFKFIWDAHQKNKEVAQLKSAVQESELQFLKTQINPHFLFNNLNNLYSYAIENSAKTPDIILELSSVLRYMLYDCKEQYVPLSKEIEHLKNFTNLNELQIENRGDISFSTTGNTSDFKIAPLILPVFIENAFKHSTASQTNNISIDVAITISNDGILTFSCSNSYLPLANNQSLSKGIGLQNVQKRLDILYPKKHKLTISDTHNKYCVKLVLALKENNKI